MPSRLTHWKEFCYEIIEHEGHRPFSDNDLRDEFLDLFGIELCDYSKVAFADEFASLFIDLCCQFCDLCFDAALLCAEGDFGNQSLHEQVCEVLFFLAQLCDYILHRGDVMSLRALFDELIVCLHEFLAEDAVLQSGAVAFCDAFPKLCRAAPYIGLPLFPAVINLVLVVLAAHTTLDHSSEWVSGLLCTDELRIFPLLPNFLCFVPCLFADDSFVGTVA